MKYMGSKNRIAKHILPIMLEYRTPEMTWVEPFVGGANMIDKVEGKRIGNDLNNYVISFWNAVKNGWIPPEFITKDYYKEIISNKQHYSQELVGWATTACTFGGTGHGYAGILSKRNYQKEAHINLEKQRYNISDVDFLCGEYYQFDIPKNSLIYCDPPYKNGEHYRNFKTINYDIFWQWCRDKFKNGHTIFISEYNAPSDFKCIWEMPLKSNIVKNGTSYSVEKLFTL
jgi:DNA adenine methylase